MLSRCGGGRGAVAGGEACSLGAAGWPAGAVEGVRRRALSVQKTALGVISVEIRAENAPRVKICTENARNVAPRKPSCTRERPNWRPETLPPQNGPIGAKKPDAPPQTTRGYDAAWPRFARAQPRRRRREWGGSRPRHGASLHPGLVVAGEGKIDRPVPIAR